MIVLRQKQPRKRNPAYLAWVRLQGCSCGCNAPPKSDAAHIRSGSIHYGKEYPGLQRRPDDSWCVPLARACHMRQHDQGELQFWEARGKDPFYLALRYNALYKAETGKDPTEDTARKRSAVAREGDTDASVSKRHRNAKHSRTASPSRPIARRKWPKRKLRSRGF
jgi:hypothetical protein